MLGVLDRAGPVDLSRYRGDPYCLPLALTASASWMSTVSRLNIPAHMPPVNAWPAPLRTHTHHSGPMWIATPSSYETFTHCHLAGFHRRTNAWHNAWHHCLPGTTVCLAPLSRINSFMSNPQHSGGGFAIRCCGG